LGVTELPGSLAESLGELEKDEVLKSALGATLYDAYMRAKLEEWDEFRLTVTDYEIVKYLETA
jgi:glutamine synthetase